MNKKDIFELKKRFKKDECTFTKLCGCYVDGQKERVLHIKETFLNVKDEEFFKYLEIAKKTLSGTIGNNLLELNFSKLDNIDNKQDFLIKLKKSGLKDESLLNDFYRSIIENYEYTGNFLILIFHDAYDVITKTNDNLKLDESEEVYEYILCAICPVSLSKPALGYLEDENRIGARIRDWVVGKPDLGFIFPAFTDRSADIDSLMYYTKNPKDPHPELMEGGLGCNSKQTATQQKETFHTIIRSAIPSDEEDSDKLLIKIQENLSTVLDEHEIVNDKDSEPVILTNEKIQNILIQSDIDHDIQNKIQKSYTEEFGDTPPVLENLIDSKALQKNAQKKKEEELEKTVEVLKQKLEETKKVILLEDKSDLTNSIAETNDTLEVHSISEDDTMPEAAVSEVDSESLETSQTDDTDDKDLENTTLNYGVVLKVNPKKVPQIKSQIIDGKKCLIIPIEDNEAANVNGVDTEL